MIIYLPKAVWKGGRKEEGKTDIFCHGGEVEVGGVLMQLVTSHPQ